MHTISIWLEVPKCIIPLEFDLNGPQKGRVDKHDQYISRHADPVACHHKSLTRGLWVVYLIKKLTISDVHILFVLVVFVLKEDCNPDRNGLLGWESVIINGTSWLLYIVFQKPQLVVWVLLCLCLHIKFLLACWSLSILSYYQLLLYGTGNRVSA